MNYLFRQWTLIIHRAANAAGEWKLNIGFSQSKRKRSQSCMTSVGKFVCRCVSVCVCLCVHVCSVGWWEN